MPRENPNKQKVDYKMQIIVLNISYFCFLLYFKFKKFPRYKWVIGVTELAGFATNLYSILDNSYTIIKTRQKFYTNNYNCDLSKVKIGFLKKLINPFMLGKMLVLGEGFIYIGSERFLDTDDEGEYEFQLIKKLQKKLVIIFLGTDIRSPLLSSRIAENKNIESVSDYLYILYPKMNTKSYEETIKKRALVAESFCENIFTANIDNISYFKKKTKPFFYLLKNDFFERNETKFQADYIPIILHCPSSPTLKGTPLVRASITRLRREGFKFIYKELIGVPNSQVHMELRLAHIVVNEFYAHVPGVFGVEAMAKFCALVTSADELIETDLPRGSNDSWMVTKSYEVYENLKILISDKKLQHKFAVNGYNWVKNNASSVNVKNIFSQIN